MARMRRIRLRPSGIIRTVVSAQRKSNVNNPPPARSDRHPTVEARR
ncbi:hypothetical protein RRSWK_01207 [Rhodopirellula sp. SWK7]|nr:hypothetical protein RRSWK_01207 [Rhodopirellula sp. SWK7]